ncbi:hypothetical protein FB451DRAFT_1401861 [Mycena latifolia]|nr:hypothetical protein FB451DRAFT_1401861 [Mycena latifolia]
MLAAAHSPQLRVALPATRLLCTPTYYPDTGHEDKIAHSINPERWFYGVLHGHVIGVVSSEKSLKNILAHNGDPHAPFVKAPMIHWQLTQQCGK